MTPEGDLWQRAWNLFHEALERDPGQRDEFLRRQCADDEKLLAEVRDLIALHDEAPELPVLSDRADENDLAEPLTGEAIGPFRLIRVIGEGGMGIVFEAEQTEPVQRRVALKLIREGMDTRETLARFRAERQALALMEHPNIARVFEAGATPEGRPYFVMELVDGVPITRYCDQHRQTTADRLRLFEQVCDGVQHAHQRGVIHRDLKPSNVLVETRGGKAIPKIIDFGVAKATAQQQLERTAFTELGRLIGTPEYMSPEQAATTGEDIDTRTDVYSLGVILYELLSGVQPIGSKELRSGGLDEVYRRIREDEPPRPSTRVGSLDAALSTDVAAKRHTDARALVTQLRGDLDWVTMKALAKERDRRYASPAHLAADLQRFRQHRPVEARPPSWRYRTSKFVRRHRVGVAVAAVVVVALVAVAVVSGVAVVRVVEAEQTARREAETAKRVSDFLVGLLSESDPARSRGRETSVREVLDRGAEQIREGLRDEPEIRAHLLRIIGALYRDLGHYEKALPLIEEAIAIRRDTLGSDHILVAEAIYGLAAVKKRAGDFEEALELYGEAHEIMLGTPGREDRNIANALEGMARSLTSLDRLDEAREKQERVVAIRERAEDRDLDLARSLELLGVIVATQGEFETARSLYSRALAIQEEALHELHPDVLATVNAIAILHWEEGDYAGARPYFERGLAITEKLYGPDHPATAALLNNVGLLLSDLEDYAAAEPLLWRSLAIREERLPTDHPDISTTVLNLGRLHGRTGRYEEAIELYERGLAMRERKLGATHSLTVRAMEGFARVLRDAGHPERADDYEQRVRATRDGAPALQ